MKGLEILFSVITDQLGLKYQENVKLTINQLNNLYEKHWVRSILTVAGISLNFVINACLTQSTINSENKIMKTSGTSTHKYSERRINFRNTVS